MGRFPQKKGHKGSLKWIQKLINDSPELLSNEIRNKFNLPSNLQIEWLSPLASDEYAEYRDQAFLNVLQISTLKTQLKEFWPKGGPQWDALGKAEYGSVFLVEAKSHIAEVISQLAAKSPKSIKKIHESLNYTKRSLRIGTNHDWTSPFYQYSNRIAHLYFLRELNNVPAHLVFVYFLNDDTMGGPKIKEEWLGALKLVKASLGIARNKLKKYTGEVFIDVGDPGKMMGQNIHLTER